LVFPDEGGDHSEAAGMVVEACRLTRLLHGVKTMAPARTVRIIYYSAIGLPPLGPLASVPDTYIDITDAMEQKIEACLTTWKFTPLPEGFAEADRMSHRYFGASVNVAYAEPFIRNLLTKKMVAVQYLTL